jgi:hypothetical protein
LDKNACSSCGFKGARLWAVPGVDVAYCVACCPLSENGYPAVWEGERLKTPTQITSLELITWQASPLWPRALQRAWLRKQTETIAAAGAQLAASGHGDWTRPIRNYLAPELRTLAQTRGLGVEALEPEDWEDFAACFDAMISLARAHSSQRIKSAAAAAPSTSGAVTIALGSIGWGRDGDLPWTGVEGEMAATYVAEFLRKRITDARRWGVVETLEIKRSRSRVSVLASSTPLQGHWEQYVKRLVAEFLDPVTPDGWRSFFELEQAARASKEAN